jgi:osmoprotectant transport system ATP-binding protein
MIKVEHLVKAFGTTKAVNDISFEVNEGENMVLLGTSGCGKTTTLKMLNRLIEPDSGTIAINGKTFRNNRPNYCAVALATCCKTMGCFRIIQLLKTLP